MGYVVQEYLDKPHLIEDLKYDLRIYVLLYGLDPMRILIHDHGLARFATEPYIPPKPGNLKNLFIHLTNYAINKHNS
jgi:tubulin polyglutamylase TTLL6/13